MNPVQTTKKNAYLKSFITEDISLDYFYINKFITKTDECESKSDCTAV